MKDVNKDGRRGASLWSAPKPVNLVAQGTILVPSVGQVWHPALFENAHQASLKWLKTQTAEIQTHNCRSPETSSNDVQSTGQRSALHSEEAVVTVRMHRRANNSSVKQCSTDLLL